MEHVRFGISATFGVCINRKAKIGEGGDPTPLGWGKQAPSPYVLSHEIW